MKTYRLILLFLLSNISLIAQDNNDFLSSGEWKVASFITSFRSNEVVYFHKDSTNNNLDFTALTYRFGEDGTYTRTNGEMELLGKWAISGDSIVIDSVSNLIIEINPLVITTMIPGAIIENQEGEFDTAYTYLSLYKEGDTPLVFNLAGNIQREDNKAVKEVNVNMNTANEPIVTDDGGDYSVLLLGNQNYIITPTKTDDVRNGVTVTDILWIQSHILNVNTLDSPYKLIAADVNNSGTITSLDLVDLMKAILHITPEFPNNTSWRFVPKSYEFSNPTQAEGAVFSESIIIENLSAAQQNLDFVAIKVGDINLTATSNVKNATDRNNNALNISLTDQQLVPNEIITLSIANTEAVKLLGYQLGINFDEGALELLEVLPSEKSGFNYTVENGLLRTLWSQEQVDDRRSNKALFQLRFRAKKAGWLSDVIHSSENNYPSIAVDEHLKSSDLQLGFNALSGKPLSFKVFPNPAQNELQLNWENNHLATSTTIQVFNNLGQAVNSIKVEETQQTSIDISGLRPGIYFLKFHQNGKIGHGNFVKK